MAKKRAKAKKARVKTARKAEPKCIFCGIVSGKVKSFKIYEDQDSVAVLDLHPNLRGQTLVIPKEHHDSYLFDQRPRDIRKLMVSAKHVAKLLERKLGVHRVHVIFEGVGVQHLHVKLYPAHGLRSKHDVAESKEEVFFERYPGYVTSILGPRAKDKDLRALVKKITK